MEDDDDDEDEDELLDDGHEEAVDFGCQTSPRTSPDSSSADDLSLPSPPKPPDSGGGGGRRFLSSTPAGPGTYPDPAGFWTSDKPGVLNFKNSSTKTECFGTYI